MGAQIYMTGRDCGFGIVRSILWAFAPIACGRLKSHKGASSAVLGTACFVGLAEGRALASPWMKRIDESG